MSPPIPIIERRRIEAELLKEVYKTLLERFGRDDARRVIAESVRRSSIAQAARSRRRRQAARASRASSTSSPTGRPRTPSRSSRSTGTRAISISTSPAAATRRCTSRWGSARSAGFCRATAGRVVLRGLRSQPQDGAHADHHGRREPLRLPLSLRGLGHAPSRRRRRRSRSLNCRGAVRPRAGRVSWERPAPTRPAPGRRGRRRRRPELSGAPNRRRSLQGHGLRGRSFPRASAHSRR